MPLEVPPLTEDAVIAGGGGGWPARYVRVLALASDGDVGFALVDTNGDGAELYDEYWFWDHDQRRWDTGGGGGAGPIDSNVS